MSTQTIDLARSIARELPKKSLCHATKIARQGDLVLTRQGDLPRNLKLKEAAAMLAEGNHGGHVALGCLTYEKEILHAGEGVVVIHTDEPSARHKALSLKPGIWKTSKLQELTIDNKVRQVQD